MIFLCTRQITLKENLKDVVLGKVLFSRYTQWVEPNIGVKTFSQE